MATTHRGSFERHWWSYRGVGDGGDGGAVGGNGVMLRGISSLTENVCLKFNKMALGTVCIFDDTGNGAAFSSRYFASTTMCTV